jgi:hypothetical protein
VRLNVRWCVLAVEVRRVDVHFGGMNVRSTRAAVLSIDMAAEDFAIELEEWNRERDVL